MTLLELVIVLAILALDRVDRGAAFWQLERGMDAEERGRASCADRPLRPDARTFRAELLRGGNRTVYALGASFQSCQRFFAGLRASSWSDD